MKSRISVDELKWFADCGRSLNEEFTHFVCHPDTLWWMRDLEIVKPSLRHRNAHCLTQEMTVCGVRLVTNPHCDVWHERWVWEPPQEPLVEYESTDLEWLEYFQIGRRKLVEKTRVIYGLKTGA